MTQIGKLYARVQTGSNPSFKELCRLAEAFGFSLKRIAGSHHIYSHPRLQGNLNLQPKGNDAKPYQVRQLLDMIDAEGLEMDGQ